MLNALVDAEFDVLRFLGLAIYRTRTLDGVEAVWCPKYDAVLVGTDLTPEEAEDLVSEIVGLLADAERLP